MEKWTVCNTSRPLTQVCVVGLRLASHNKRTTQESKQNRDKQLSHMFTEAGQWSFTAVRAAE